MIKTKKVKDRRKLRFESPEAVIAEAEALAVAEREGTVRALGNWTLGQAIGHVACWANAPFDGYPEMRPLPWLMKVMLPLFKNRFLNKGLPAGAEIPGVPGGTFGIDTMATDQALGELGRGFARLKSMKPTVDNPLFGQMTHEEWIKLNLRHAELHLSFFHPR